MARGLNAEPSVVRWAGPAAPSEHAILTVFQHEAMAPRPWSNGPFDRYAPHRHGYHKLLYCVRGSITFVLHPSGRAIELRPGDRMELPRDTEHSAVVGPQGVACIEGYR